jgi:hypothetical protein
MNVMVRLTCALLATAVAAAAQQAPATHPHYWGFWELRHDSFAVPRAKLTPAAQAGEAAQIARDLEAIQRCVPMGVPALMSDRPVLNLQHSPAVIGIVPKGPASVRYIHTDGRPHPPVDEWEGATNGHSIGRWEGDTLVVDTIGFNDRGLTGIPGGGWRTPDSRLTERFRLLNDGLVLSVTATWEDAKVFAAPHSYEFRYYRVAPANEPRSHNCLGGDQERARFLSSGATLMR